MNEPEPAVTPFLNSPVFVHILVSIVMQLLAIFNVAHLVTSADVASLIDLLLQGGAIAFALYAAWKRKRSKIQPLTLTQAGADLAIAEASLPTIPTVTLPPQTSATRSPNTRDQS